MKFTIKTKDLAAALQTVAVAVETKTTLPILSNVLIQAGKNGITISATNLDVYASIAVPAKVKKDGEITVAFRLLQRLIGQVRDSETVISLSEKTLTVESGTIAANFETLGAEEFPPPLSIKTEGVKCDPEDFMEPFRMLAHAMSSDETRYVLNGINLAPGKKGTDFAATNGSRVAMFESDKKLTEVDAIIPSNVISALLLIQPKGEATMTLADGIFFLKAGDLTLNAKLVEGKYPNYKQVVPQPSKDAFICLRSDLIHAVKTCAVFLTKMSLGVQLAGEGKQIEVSRRPQAKVIVIGSELTGQPAVTINLQALYLMEALEVLSGDEVKIEVTDGRSPIVIREGKFLACMAPFVTA